MWDEAQLEAAHKYGEIEDIMFPGINPNASTEEVRGNAEEYADRITAMKPDYVLCQGEHCMVYQVVSILKARGIRVGAACSERRSVEEMKEDGVHKSAVFKFVQFREY
jgi:NAD(P)H-flavin reductase